MAEQERLTRRTLLKRGAEGTVALASVTVFTVGADRYRDTNAKKKKEIASIQQLSHSPQDQLAAQTVVSAAQTLLQSDITVPGRIQEIIEVTNSPTLHQALPIVAEINKRNDEIATLELQYDNTDNKSMMWYSGIVGVAVIADLGGAVVQKIRPLIKHKERKQVEAVTDEL